MLSCKRSRFSLPRNITYLNCSYLSPMMKSVEKAGIRGLRVKRNPARISPADFFTDPSSLRSAFGKLINAPADRIAIIPSVSYGMATVAANLQMEKGQKIIVAAEQFPSNYYVWQRLCGERSASLEVVAPPDTWKDRGRLWNERIIDAIDAKTRAVAIAHTHWADGTRFDLEAIRARTLEVGALLIVDGTQSVGAMPFDSRTIKPDALICAGYKWLLGPYSMALAYYGEHFTGGKPLEESWISRLNSQDFSALVNYNADYQPGALRYDVGEHGNFINVPMMLKAVEQINRWGIEDIQSYCLHITSEAIESLREKGCWIEDDRYRGGHIFGIRLPPGVDPDRVKTLLQKERIIVSFRGNAIRVSPYLYNDVRDLKKLVKVLTRA